MKTTLEHEQASFLLHNYIRDFIERNFIDVEGLTFDEMCDTVMSDSNLSPRFSCYLINQIRKLVFNGEAQNLLHEFQAINN